MANTVDITSRAAMLSNSVACRQARHQLKLQDHGHGDIVWAEWCACLLSRYTGTKLYCLETEAYVFERLAQGDTQGGSAAAGIEPAISNGKSNARTIDVQDIYS